VGDRELQSAAVQVVALGKALEVTQLTLNAAHVFIDVVTRDESESVLSAEDTELAEIVHAGIIEQGNVIEQLGEDLAAALETIVGLTDEEVALVQEAAGQLPTKSADDDGVGQYL
jgi:hypothetical protein